MAFGGVQSEKKRSRPLIGTRAFPKHFVVPPKFSLRRQALLRSVCCGEQSADVSVPARKLSSLRLPRRASSQRRASLCAVVRSYSCFVVAVHF